MTRLTEQLQRLFPPAEGDGRLRRMVLALRVPADWAALGRVWQGVQADFDWPAPAIVVSGQDDVQLWFALQQPVDPAEGAAVLRGLAQRHLADQPVHRLRLLPGSDGWQPAAAPALQSTDGDGERWSAFVAPDLAPMFSDTPWLDVAPNPEGQASLLAGLRAITAEEWQRALAAVQPAGEARSSAAAAASAGPFSDPRAFLLSVMNDPAQPMGLRIDAAKALLPPG